MKYIRGRDSNFWQRWRVLQSKLGTCLQCQRSNFLFWRNITHLRLWHILYLLSVTIWSITINLLLLITIEVVNSYSLIRISSIFSIKRQSIKRLFKKSIVQTIVTFLIWILIIALNRVWSYVYCNMKNVWNLVDSKNAI